MDQFLSLAIALVPQPDPDGANRALKQVRIARIRNGRWENVTDYLPIR